MFDVLYDEAAEDDLRSIRAFDTRRILDEVEKRLARNPARPGRRIKLLEGLITPWNAVRPVWQLRVGVFRIFYDVDEEHQEVIVRAVRRKGRKTTEEVI